MLNWYLHLVHYLFSLRSYNDFINYFFSYVPWNRHEEVKGQFNFKGILDMVWVYIVA